MPICRTHVPMSVMSINQNISLIEDFPLSSDFRLLHFSFEPQHPSCQYCHSDQMNYARSKSGLCLKIVKDDPQTQLICLAFWFASKSVNCCCLVAVMFNSFL